MSLFAWLHQPSERTIAGNAGPEKPANLKIQSGCPTRGRFRWQADAEAGAGTRSVQ